MRAHAAKANGDAQNPHFFFFVGHHASVQPTHTMLVFIIHTFVLHTDNMFPRGRGRKAEINNSDKSCLVRGEEKG